MNGLRDVQAAGASVTELIIQAVERSGYRERLEIEDTPESRDRLENLSELVSMASDFDDDSSGAGTTLVDFLERLSLSSANDEEDGRGNTRITLMTIHAAKGLEFPVVFMCGMEEGLFPSLREREGTDERDALEEERRLAYVAMTRAMDRLVLTNARVRRQWGEVRINFPSRFIDEIPAECMAVRARAAAARVVVPEPELGRMHRPRVAVRASHDELDQRVQYDDVPEYHADEYGGRNGGGERAGGGIQAGVWVSHASFGEGKVIKAQGAGRDRKLLIDFSEVGLKTVLERFVERT
jgi:DNA helicase-2/ATP-dependent DNA helicase PcrA